MAVSYLQTRSRFRPGEADKLSETVSVKDFGAVGDGVVDDTAALQAWADELISSGRRGYIDQGTYLIGSVTFWDIENLTIEGAGPGLTHFVRKDGHCTADFMRMLDFRNLLGTSAKINLSGFSIDGNAAGNPLLGGDAFSLQHCNEIYLVPRDALGFGEVRIANISGFDPVADLIGLGGSPTLTYGSINISNITSSGRTRERSDINILGSWDEAAITNCNVDCIELETNDAVAATLRHNMVISNVNCRDYLSLYAEGALTAGIRPKLSAAAITVGGHFQFGEFDGEVVGLEATLTEACRFYNGRMKFIGGRITASAAFVHTAGAMCFWQSGSGVEELVFEGTVFDADPAAVTAGLSHFFRENGANRTTTSEIAFVGCKFKSATVKGLYARNGPYRFERCQIAYAGSKAFLECSAGWTVAGVANSWRLYDNEMMSAAGYLLQLPHSNISVAGTMYARGNKVPGGDVSRIFLNSRPDIIAPPHGASTLYIFAEVDRGRALVAPTVGTFLKGQAYDHYDAGSGEPLGFVCTTTGALGSAAWVTLTAYTVGDFVSRGGQQYVCVVAGTSGATGPVRTTAGTETDGTVTWRWWPTAVFSPISASTVSVMDFGAVGDNIADDTAAFLAAIASGQSLFLPKGIYRITGTLRITTTRQSIYGCGWASQISLRDNAQLIIGDATGLATGGTTKTGTKPTGNMLRDFWVQAITGHVGAITQIDYADDVKLVNFMSTLAGYTASSGAYATGLKVRWCQWLDVVNCDFMGNKYGVHFSVEDRSPFNEGHFTFVGGRVSIEKAVEAGIRTATVCMEMIRSGSALIHTVFYNTHFLNNSTGLLRENKSGMLFKTDLVGTCLYTNYKPVAFRDCEFEACGKVVDFGSESSATATGRCTIDGIEVLNADYVGYGLDATKTSVELGRLYVDGDLTAGHAAFDGCGVQPLEGAGAAIGDTVLPAGVIDSNHSLLSLRDASGRRVMRPLRQSVLAGAVQVDVTHTLDYIPELALVVTSWRTDYYITSIGATTFRVVFGTPPSANSNIYCFPLKGANFLENSTAAGTLYAQWKTGDYTLVRDDRDRTVTMNSPTTPRTITIPASATLGLGFACRIANIGAAALTLTVTGTGNVTLAQNEMRTVFFSGATGTVCYAGAAVAISAMS